MSDLEELRKKRMQQLLYEQQARSPERQQHEQQEAQAEQLINNLIKQILTPEARERLANIRLARPEYAREIELVLIQLHQQGRLRNKVSDKDLKEMLNDLSKRRRKEINIKHD